MAETPTQTIARLRREKAELEGRLDAALIAVQVMTAARDSAVTQMLAALADVAVLRGRVSDLEHYERVIRLCATDLRPLIDCVAEFPHPNLTVVAGI